MKHLKYFEQASAYETYKNGGDYTLPNVSYIVESNEVKYGPRPLLKSFTFHEWLYFDAGDVYDTKTFYYEDGMTFGQFVNSKYNTDNYFTFIPEYEYLTLSKTEWPTKVYRVHGVAISEYPKQDTPIDRFEFSQGLICHEPEDISYISAITCTISLYKNSTDIRTFKIKEGTTWEEFIPTLRYDNDFNNWALHINGNLVEFYDLDQMLGYKPLYGPNGQVKKTDVIIDGVHYTSQQ